MKTIKVGAVEIRGNFKATRKELADKFGKYLTAAEFEELNKQVNRGRKPRKPKPTK